MHACMVGRCLVCGGRGVEACVCIMVAFCV